MEQIQYIGERLLPGQIGHFAIIFGFIASLMAIVAYFFATQKRETPEHAAWRRLGRGAFVAHGLSVLVVIGVLFYVMTNKYYEYNYAWAHVGEDLPFKYIFAAFWEGQEGSFLLWMFWHVVLGILLIFSAKEWESPVMAVLSAVQLFIGSMLLGIYAGFGDEVFKIGSNPTLLLRDTMNAPIFANANYVSLIKGNGLNPLLQNWWMTIHPPTLFLGFASTTVPFAYAIAGLWMRKHTEVLKVAMPWALMSGAILGTGIVMGAAWAYEALSFGGYWAWDPVENMSLVPWLVLVAGIHTNLVAKATGHSIRSTYIFYLLSFLLVLYSTFLTRSGILGESSVHAFTEMGLEWQLVAFLGTFLLLGIVMLTIRYKGIPNPVKEEPTASREFWMFIGSLVLLFSALIITTSTSLPVYNRIVRFFDPEFKGVVIVDVIKHHNGFQVWIAIIMGLLSGVAQYLRFREMNWKQQASRFKLHLFIAIVVASVLTWLTMQWIEIKALPHDNYWPTGEFNSLSAFFTTMQSAFKSSLAFIWSWQYLYLLFAAFFTVITNLDYIITFLKGNLKMGGSVLAHIGFGLMIVGILASGLNKKFISSNPFAMTGLIEGGEDAAEKNILLFKNEPMYMSGYEVTYEKDTMDVLNRTYTVNYKRKNEQGKVVEEFNLEPNILYDKSFTKIAASNPSTRHYWNKDVFTHINSLANVEMDLTARQKREDSLNYKRFDVPVGQTMPFLDTVKLKKPDTFMIKDYTITVENIIEKPTHPDYQPTPGDVAVGATVRLKQGKKDSTYTVTPVFVLKEEGFLSFPVQINGLNAKVRLHPAILQQFFTYREFNLKQGETITYNDLQIQFASIITKPQHPAYQAQQGDIPVGMQAVVRTKDGQQYTAEPVFVIRGNQIFALKVEIPELNLHLRFASVNPNTEQAQLFVAQTNKSNVTSVPVEVATNSLRSDYIVLEAIEFPGINFFWIGCTMMMVGLTVSMAYRISKK